MALSAAHAWHEKIAAGLEHRLKSKEMLEKSLQGVEFVMELPGNMAAYKLTTSAAVDFESEYMENIKCYCLVMSQNYIKNHYNDIKKYASVIESRLSDEDYTIESALKENDLILKLVTKHNTNYILIDDEYSVNIDL